MKAATRFAGPLCGIALTFSVPALADEAVESGSEAASEQFSDPNVVVTNSRIQGRERNDGPVWRGPIITPDPEYCRNRIIETYGEEGDAQLRREPASPDQPLHVLAVDHRVQGCSVLVLEDGRKQLPPAPSSEGLVVPAQ